MTADLVEVRMLGRLFVRRSSGTAVEFIEWHNGKATDLLRLLALQAGQPVRVPVLLDRLWPDVDEAKARASLRTAASEVRHVVGAHCLERHLDTLSLVAAWVDVIAFQQLADDAAESYRMSEFALVVDLARKAEALFVGDFTAYDDTSRWVMETRESLQATRRRLLADAADSAVNLLWMRDAIEFATRALRADPSFERPHRALMRAHAGLGETDLALRAFEHCRSTLANELGADPSPQTLALHIALLSGYGDVATDTPVVARTVESRQMTALMNESILRSGCDVICVIGTPGSGREFLLAHAADDIKDAVVHRLLGAKDGMSPAEQLDIVLRGAHTDIALTAPIDEAGPVSIEALAKAISALDPDESSVIALPATIETGRMLGTALKGSNVRFHKFILGPIGEKELSVIAAAVLSGKPTTHLLQELGTKSKNRVGSAVTVLREWAGTGQIISSAKGLELLSGPDLEGSPSQISRQFHLLLEQIGDGQLKVCQLLAIADQPLSVDELVQLQAANADGFVDSARIQALLDRLTDLGVLREVDGAYEFRHNALREIIDDWMRPSVRRELRDRITEFNIDSGTITYAVSFAGETSALDSPSPFEVSMAPTIRARGSPRPTS